MIKFKDDFHENTEDGFEVKKGYRSRPVVTIYQEFDSGVVREILLTPSDIEQIHNEITKANVKS